MLGIDPDLLERAVKALERMATAQERMADQTDQYSEAPPPVGLIK